MRLRTLSGIRGKTVRRRARRRVDFLLLSKPNLPIAVIEAKDNNHSIGDGMQQGLGDAESLDVPFVFSSNGDGFLFHNKLVTDGPVEPQRLSVKPEHSSGLAILNKHGCLTRLTASFLTWLANFSMTGLGDFFAWAALTAADNDMLNAGVQFALNIEPVDIAAQRAVRALPTPPTEIWRPCPRLAA